MQDEQVYLSDPHALYTVVVKDQYVFEETSMFIQYVFQVVADELTM